MIQYCSEFGNWYVYAQYICYGVLGVGGIVSANIIKTSISDHFKKKKDDK